MSGTDLIIKEAQADLLGEIVGLKVRIEQLLKQLGDPGRCRGCAAKIYWVVSKRSKTGRPSPYDPDGISHFATCPQAAAFRTKKPDANPGT